MSSLTHLCVVSRPLSHYVSRLSSSTKSTSLPIHTHDPPCPPLSPSSPHTHLLLSNGRRWDASEPPCPSTICVPWTCQRYGCRQRLARSKPATAQHRPTLCSFTRLLHVLPFPRVPPTQETRGYSASKELSNAVASLEGSASIASWQESTQNTCHPETPSVTHSRDDALFFFKYLSSY